MEAEKLVIGCGCILGVLVILGISLCIRKREKSRRKIKHMPKEEKWKALSDLIEPFGFAYEREKDILVSHLDAWQRKQGYMTLFDDLAPKFHMMIDAIPIYFDYNGQTWLIEFWKGQYGINMGAEVGVYHAKYLVPKEQRTVMLYDAVSNEEMPLMGMCLEWKGQKEFSRKANHWWLSGFCMGRFASAKDLRMYVNIVFPEPTMAQEFVKGLEEAGMTRKNYRLRGSRASVVLEETRHVCGIQKLHSLRVQVINCFFCCAYLLVTRPFTSTLDRMLFLYEQLPWCMRRMLRLHAFGRKSKP